MFTKTIKTAVAALLLVGSVAVAKDGIYFNAVQGNAEEAYNEMINVLDTFIPDSDLIGTGKYCKA